MSLDADVWLIYAHYFVNDFVHTPVIKVDSPIPCVIPIMCTIHLYMTNKTNNNDANWKHSYRKKNNKKIINKSTVCHLKMSSITNTKTATILTPGTLLERCVWSHPESAGFEPWWHPQVSRVIFHNVQPLCSWAVTNARYSCENDRAIEVAAQGP